MRRAGRWVARWVALCGASAALAGCAARPAPPMQPALAEVLPPAAGVEGRYRGTARLVRADSSACPRSGPRTLELAGPVVTLAYSVPPRQRVSLTAEVRSDGRILAEDGVGTLDGQWTAGRLEVTISSAMCEHRWTMNRIA